MVQNRNLMVLLMLVESPDIIQSKITTLHTTSLLLSEEWAMGSYLIVAMNFCISYWLEALFGSILLIITIFRREISCNRSYLDEDETIESTASNNTNCEVDGNHATENSNDFDTTFAREYAESIDVGFDLDMLLESSGRFNPKIDLLHNFFSNEIVPLLHVFSYEYYVSMIPRIYVDIGALVFQGECESNRILDETSKHDSSSKGIVSSVCPNHRHSFFSRIPEDSQIHILSFLCPMDITKFACVSHQANALATSDVLWRNILLRDFNYVLTEWSLAKSAFARFSLSTELSLVSFLSCRAENLDKKRVNQNCKYVIRELYFTFLKTWINWSLAGCNTYECCYVGLHNSVFNITNFIDEHPGSTETLLMHSGRDATEFFEDVGHSKAARKIAAEGMCEIFLGYDAHGFKEISNIQENGQNFSNDVQRILPFMRSRKRRKTVPTLKSIQHKLDEEERFELRKVQKWKKSNGHIEMIGDVNIFYDPFFQRWRWWFLDSNIKPVFLDKMKDC